jgi:nicotinate-nucleotide adenylyltransferase
VTLRTLVRVAIRVGIFGGTFDPPHIGHLSVAVHARHALELDEVLLVVAHDPWQKRDIRQITAAEHRLEMTSLAVEGLDGLAASSVEMRRGGASYTIDTVEQLVAEAAQAGREIEPVVIVGRDAALGLDSWFRADELRDMCVIAMADRPGADDLLPPGWRIEPFESPLIDVSSSDLRRRIAVSAPIEVLVPSRLIDYIRSHGFYSA